ncbi:hypothetical protein DSECCO2_531390 [anaerobic digester metagenome]
MKSLQMTSLRKNLMFSQRISLKKAFMNQQEMTNFQTLMDSAPLCQIQITMYHH